MAEKTVRLIESIKNDGFNDGFDEGRMKLIKSAVENHSIEEIAEFLNITVNEVKRYVEM